MEESERRELRQTLLTRYMVNFEVCYGLALEKRRHVFEWLNDPRRRWPDGGEPPKWARQFERLSTEEAETLIQLRSIGEAVAETILTATRPDLDDPPAIDPSR